MHLPPHVRLGLTLSFAVVELLDSSPLASLKLSWLTAEKQHEVFVGWDGGASEALGLIDVPLELASCLGLSQDMQVFAPAAVVQSVKAAN